MTIPIPPARVQLPYKPPVAPRPGQFLPPNASDHLEEFYTQQSADWHYLLEVGKYLEAVSPSALMADFTDPHNSDHSASQPSGTSPWFCPLTASFI